MKKCAKCEKELAEKYRFCPFCGCTIDNSLSQQSDFKKGKEEEKQKQEKEQEEFMIGFGLAF